MGAMKELAVELEEFLAERGLEVQTVFTKGKKETVYRVVSKDFTDITELALTILDKCGQCGHKASSPKCECWPSVQSD